MIKITTRFSLKSGKYFVKYQYTFDSLDFTIIVFPSFLNCFAGLGARTTANLTTSKGISSSKICCSSRCLKYINKISGLKTNTCFMDMLKMVCPEGGKSINS
ncbi:hypothetical protein HZS_6991 [Henneguya salminicola]|nr:hypothetical protein HZS_6991 [Henneguya salminicola]